MSGKEDDFLSSPRSVHGTELRIYDPESKRTEANMCLGVPGRVLEVEREELLGLLRGKVQFGGITKEVNLMYTPEVRIGDYVIVHVGFAISRLDEEEAMRVFSYLEQLGDLKQLEISDEGA
jgi:hydrogenase expression/formation protein HypC